MAAAPVLVWDSLAQSTARAETQSHTDMVRKLDALVDDSNSFYKRVWHVHFAAEYLPLTCIEAPVTEFEIVILKDLEVRPAWERLALSILSNVRAVEPEGFRSLALGTVLGDPLTNIYLGGWDSVEVCVSVA